MADNVPDAVAIFNKADHIAVPVIVLGEFRFGAAQSRKRKDYENWLVKLIAASFVLHIDEQTTTYYAAVRFELKQIGRADVLVRPRVRRARAARRGARRTRTSASPMWWRPFAAEVSKTGRRV